MVAQYVEPEAKELLPWAYNLSEGLLTWYLNRTDPSTTAVDAWFGGGKANSRNSPLVGMGHSDGRVEVLDGETGSIVETCCSKGGKAIISILFAPDGKTLWYLCDAKKGFVFALEITST